MRVVAAMSGGVDSAVAAARMVDAGHDVVGVHLALSQNAATLRESARGCCTIEDASDARRVADVIGIPFYVWDMAARFKTDVVDDFIAEYAAGRTPNPCLRCNEKIKFAALLDKALALGFDAVATGHYAQIVEGASGARQLHRAVDMSKDQSYVLGVLDAGQLARSFFPLGDTTKPQIRQEAAARGFNVAAKPDSHDICFIPDGDTRTWLTNRLGEQPGDIVDSAGTKVGTHSGAYAFTVGQRRGLRLGQPAAGGEPRYVLEVQPETNTVVVATGDLLGADAITGDRARWCGPAPDGVVSVGAQVRAHGEEVPAEAWVEGGPAGDTAGRQAEGEQAEGEQAEGEQAEGEQAEREQGEAERSQGEHAGGERLEVRLIRRIRGVSPGQSVVLYDGTRVVGSATITRASTVRPSAAG